MPESLKFFLELILLFITKLSFLFIGATISPIIGLIVLPIRILMHSIIDFSIFLKNYLNILPGTAIGPWKNFLFNFMAVSFLSLLIVLLPCWYFLACTADVVLSPFLGAYIGLRFSFNILQLFILNPFYEIGTILFSLFTSEEYTSLDFYENETNIHIPVIARELTTNNLFMSLELNQQEIDNLGQIPLLTTEQINFISYVSMRDNLQYQIKIDSYLNLKNRLDTQSCCIFQERPDSENVIVLTKQKRVHDTWEVVRGSSQIFDKDSLCDWIRAKGEEAYHPITRDNLFPRGNTTQNTRYVWHHYYIHNSCRGVSLELQVLLQELHSILDKLQQDVLDYSGVENLVYPSCNII